MSNTTNLRTVKFAEIADLPAHPVADIFPMLEKKAESADNRKTETITLAELATSIEANGLQEPIVLFNDTILDGRNRRAACKLAGIEEVQVVDFSGTEEEAEEFILALNIDRRDLTPGQRAFVAIEYFDLVSKGKGARTDLQPDSNLSQVRTADQLAARFRVSNGYISQARSIKQKALAEQEAAERNNLEAERLKAEAEQKRLEAEALRQAGEEARAKDAIAASNQATSAAADARDRAKLASNAATDKINKIQRVKSGSQTMGSLVAKNPGQEIRSDNDPLELAMKQANDGMNRFLEALDTVNKAPDSNNRDKAVTNIFTKFRRIESRIYELGFAVDDDEN